MTARPHIAELDNGGGEPTPSQAPLGPIVLCLMTSNGVEMTELLASLIQTECEADFTRARDGRTD